MVSKPKAQAHSERGKSKVKNKKRGKSSPLGDAELFKAVVEHSQDAILFLDPERKILYASPAIKHISGYDPKEIIGKHGFEFSHPDEQETINNKLREALQNPGKPLSIEIRLKHKNGSWFWVDVTATNFLGQPHVQSIVVNMRDITERRHHENELAQRAGNMSALAEISRQIHTSLNLDLVYENTHQAIRRLMPCDAFIIALLDDAKQIIEDVYLWDKEQRWPGSQQSLGKGLTNYIISTSKALRVADWDESHDRLTESSNFGDPQNDTRSILAMPLFHSNGKCFGMISAQAYAPHAYTAEHEQLMSTLSHQVSKAIENAKLFDELQQELAERQKAEQALRDSEMLYRRAIEVAGAVPYLQSYVSSSTSVEFNFIGEGIRQITGYGPEEFNDQLWDAITQERVLLEDLAEYSWAEAVQRVRSGANPIWKCEHRIRHRNGEIRWVFEAAVELRDEQGVSHGSIGMYQDITARKLADEALILSKAQLLRQLRRLNALHTIDMAINSNANIQITLEVLLTQVLSQLSVDAADVLLFNQPAQTLELTAGRGFRSNISLQSQQRLGDGFAGQVINSRRTVHISNILGTSKDLKQIRLLTNDAFVEYFGVPLIAKGFIKGVLEIYHRSPVNPEDDWLNFMEVLAGRAAIAIDNAQLLQGLQRSNMEMILAYDATIEGWSRAMDLRDKEPEGHSQRVTALTLKLARAMGIREADILHIQRGGLLHDIGTLGVPDNILLKAETLTDAEWQIMRQHPVYAMNMISPITHLKPALDIPYCHHEKWDGTGYPRGLKGEQIPLAARIFAVVDVWDALTSDRPYRKAWAKEKTIEYIQEQAEKHFDPQVVNAFLELISADQDIQR